MSSNEKRVAQLRGAMKLLLLLALPGIAALWLMAPGKPVETREIKPLRADLSDLRPGQHRIVYAEPQQYFVLYRTPQMLATLSQGEVLLDPDSLASEQPEALRTPLRALREERLVLFNKAPDNGCPLGFNGKRINDLCRGSQYDLSGRVLQNQLSKKNVAVPEYRWEGETLMIDVVE